MAGKASDSGARDGGGGGGRGVEYWLIKVPGRYQNIYNQYRFDSMVGSKRIGTCACVRTCMHVWHTSMIVEHVDPDCGFEQGT